MVATPSIMTVMAHPDDAELWAGGTLARHAQSGGSVTIVVPRLDKVRDAEAKAAAAILGARLFRLDSLTPEAIQAVLIESRPTVVITHPVNDIHPEHQAAAQILLSALPQAVIATGRPARLYTCDGYNNLDQCGLPLDLPTIIDVTDTFHTKMQALNVHRSQPIANHFGPMAEALSRLHGQRIGAHHAEAFRSMPILGRMQAAESL